MDKRTYQGVVGSFVAVSDEMHDEARLQHATGNPTDQKVAVALVHYYNKLDVIIDRLRKQVEEDTEQVMNDPRVLS